MKALLVVLVMLLLARAVSNERKLQCISGELRVVLWPEPSTRLLVTKLQHLAVLEAQLRLIGIHIEGFNRVEGLAYVITEHPEYLTFISSAPNSRSEQHRLLNLSIEALIGKNNIAASFTDLFGFIDFVNQARSDSLSMCSSSGMSEAECSAMNIRVDLIGNMTRLKNCS